MKWVSGTSACLFDLWKQVADSRTVEAVVLPVSNMKSIRGEWEWSQPFCFDKRVAKDLWNERHSSSHPGAGMPAIYTPRGRAGEQSGSSAPILFLFAWNWRGRAQLLSFRSMHGQCLFRFFPFLFSLNKKVSSIALCCMHLLLYV